MTTPTQGQPDCVRLRARQLLQAIAPLDYTAIVAHHPDAIAALRQALVVLGLRPAPVDEPLANYAQTQAPAKPARREPDADQRRSQMQAMQRHLVEALSHSGFGDRLGKVYDSKAARKLIAFKEVPHKRGLPGFALVVAPDYAPASGIHAVFMNAQEVWSAFLPHPGDQYQWQVRERRRFTSVQEFTELVTLLCAGFPLP